MERQRKLGKNKQEMMKAVSMKRTRTRRKSLIEIKNEKDGKLLDNIFFHDFYLVETNLQIFFSNDYDFDQ